jgi:hypothetical protein
MLLIIVAATIVAVGLIAVAIAHPGRANDVIVWNDAAERRLLHERTARPGWW